MMAIRTKRTVERGGLLGYRVVAIVLVIGLAAIGRLVGVSAQSYLWHTSLALGIVCDCIVLAGTAFTVWARIALGRNWSAEVTFKQDHELIESGPYALVRHPIYTGLIVMALGTAIDYGRAIGFAVFVGLLRCAVVEGPPGGTDHGQSFPPRLRRLPGTRARDRSVPALEMRWREPCFGSGAGVPCRRSSRPSDRDQAGQ